MTERNVGFLSYELSGASAMAGPPSLNGNKFSNVWRANQVNNRFRKKIRIKATPTKEPEIKHLHCYRVFYEQPNAKSRKTRINFFQAAADSGPGVKLSFDRGHITRIILTRIKPFH